MIHPAFLINPAYHSPRHSRRLRRTPDPLSSGSFPSRSRPERPPDQLSHNSQDIAYLRPGCQMLPLPLQMSASAGPPWQVTERPPRILFRVCAISYSFSFSSSLSGMRGRTCPFIRVALFVTGFFFSCKLPISPQPALPALQRSPGIPLLCRR